MKTPFVPAALVSAAVLAGLTLVTTPIMAGDWTSWRGPNGNQISPETSFPTRWKWARDGAEKENIRWRVALPEPGNSSPILLGQRVFLTQALDDGKRRALLAFDRTTGKELWRREVAWAKDDPRHETNPALPGGWRR